MWTLHLFSPPRSICFTLLGGTADWSDVANLATAVTACILEAAVLGLMILPPTTVAWKADSLTQLLDCWFCALEGLRCLVCRFHGKCNVYGPLECQVFLGE